MQIDRLFDQAQARLDARREAAAARDEARGASAGGAGGTGSGSWANRWGGPATVPRAAAAAGDSRLARALARLRAGAARTGG